MVSNQKRRVSKFTLAQKALLTSSASRRFRQEGPEEEDIKLDVGSNQPAEDAEEFYTRLRQEHGEALEEEERKREALLLRNIPRAQQAEVIRKYRLDRQRQLIHQREAEEAAPEEVIPGSDALSKGALSAYGLEDAAAKRTRSALSQMIHGPEGGRSTPGNRYLGRGGPTYLVGANQISAGKPTRITDPLDIQVIGPTERGKRRVPSNQMDIVADQIASSVAGGETDLDNLMSRFSEETEAELRPRIEGRLRERGVDLEGNRIDRIEQVLAPEDVVFKAEDRAKAAQLFNLRERLRIREREITEQQNKTLRDTPIRQSKPTRIMRGKGGKTTQRVVDPLDQEKKKLQATREAVEKELSNIKPDALIDGVRQSPEETERRVRQQVEQALTVPDPLGRPRRGPLNASGERAGGFGFAARAAEQRGEDTSQYREYLPRVATDEQIEALVKSTVDIHHAATHAERVQAQQRAEHLSNQISQQVQKIVSKRQEQADQERIKGELRKQGILPPLPVPIKPEERLPPDTKRVLEHVRHVARSEHRVPNMDEIGRSLGISSRAAETHFDKLEKAHLIGRLPDTNLPVIVGNEPGMWSREILQQIYQTREGQIPSGAGWVKRPPPPPGAFGAIPGGPAWEPPRRPYKDPRFNDLTVEDVYRIHNHERIAPLLNWRKDRLKAKFLGEPFNERKPVPFEALDSQARFLKNRTQARAKGFVEGTETIGLTGQGKPVPFDSRQGYQAAIGVTPNILYTYELRNPKLSSDQAQSKLAYLEELEMQLEGARRSGKSPSRQLLESVARQREAVKEFTGPIKKQVPPEDTRTTFHEAVRGRQGQILYPEDFDEIVAPVGTTRRQTQRFGFEFGQRVPKTGRETLPKGIDEIRYVPVPGAKGQTRTEEDRSQLTTHYFVAPRGGRSVEVTHGEYQQHQQDIDEARANNRADPVTLTTTQVPRHIQYKVMDPKELELASTRTRDVARIRIPEIKLGKRTFGERLPQLQFSGNEESPYNKYVGTPLRQYAQSERLEAARRVTEPASNINPELHERYSQKLMERHGIKDKKEAKLIAEAAAAAGFYSARDRFKEGYLPAAGNRIIKHLPGGERAGWAVNEAIVRPVTEKLVQIPELISHPLTAVDQDLAGIEISRFKYRQEGLINKQTVARRMFERQTNQLKKMERTAKFVEGHKEDWGPIGAYTRWRLGPMSKLPSYQLGRETGILHDAAVAAREGTSNDQIRYFRNRGGAGDVIHFDPLKRVPGESISHEELRRMATRKAASNLQGQYNLTKRTLEHNPFSPAMRGTGPGFVSRAFEHSGMERNVLIGGAAIGTVAGAAYLYHKHQEDKKPENQRTAFYNRILPPEFETPKVFPRARVLKRMQFGNEAAYRELGLTGKEVPVQFGLSLRSKKVALRPSDRGYDPNLPLIGRPSLRGTPGGSTRKGLTYNPPGSRGVGDIGRRTRIKRGTHDVYLAGHKVPGQLNLGDLRRVPMQSGNPNQISAADRENIIWAHTGTALEDHVKAFYRGAGGSRAESLLETWDDPEAVERIRRQKGQRSTEYQRYVRRLVRQRQTVT